MLQKLYGYGIDDDIKQIWISGLQISSKNFDQNRFLTKKLTKIRNFDKKIKILANNLNFVQLFILFFRNFKTIKPAERKSHFASRTIGKGAKSSGLEKIERNKYDVIFSNDSYAILCSILQVRFLKKK